METDSEIINAIAVKENPGRQDITNSTKGVKLDIQKYWDKDYINQKIDSVNNLRHKMLLNFLWMSGVRISEATTLQKQSIDFKNYTMTVRWLKNRKYLYRVVPLHPTLRDIMQVYTAPMKAEDRVFPISRQRGWQIVNQTMQGHPHQFRHSFAVNWLRCGGDLIILHKILGHAKIQTTMVYLDIIPIDQGKELMKIEFR
jgi:site-specific recombinase XerD